LIPDPAWLTPLDLLINNSVMARKAEHGTGTGAAAAIIDQRRENKDIQAPYPGLTLMDR
jgi:hypothetical protein